MSSPRNNKQHAAESQTGSVKRIDNGRQHVQQDPAASESCFNSLSDAEEHFEFSPDITDDPQGGEELGLNDSKLSSDSFRSTSSASSVSNNNNNNNNPFPRNNHLRQSFTGRTTSWSPRSGFNRRSLTSNNNCNNNQLKCISANGHARQMFASSGTSPSSRRSSFSDEAISSNDPASLEDDVLDLTQKIASLEQQVSALNQSQVSNDDRYLRVKQENSTLQSRVHSLEEQLRDIESQNEEQRKLEERRNRESMARLEKEKMLESRQYVTQIVDLQQELFDAKENVRHYLTTVNKLKEDRERLQDVISNKEEEIERLVQELVQVKEAVRRHRDEEISRERVCNVLQEELNDLKQIRSHQMHGCNREDHSLAESKITQLELTLSSLRVDNQNLRESNEELQAQLLTSRLEEGRCLIRNGERVTTSLADELVTLNEEQSDDILQLRQGLMEQQEVNAELRRYIDGVLMNIIENYPQLLEVKQVDAKPN